MSIPSTKPLRILRVVHTLRRESGGPSESIKQSTEALLTLGHQIEVVTADDLAFASPLPAAAVFHPLGSRDAKTLGAWLRQHHQRFDAVLVHGLWQTGWVVRQTLRHTTTPYLVFPHGMLDPQIRRAYPLKHLAKQLYWWLRERHVLRDAAAVCFTCEEERRLAQHTFTPYQSHEKVVAYGTAGPPEKSETQREALTQRFPALAQKSFLLFLSRIHDKKGLSELISAYAKFAAKNSQAPALVIAGPCSDESYAAQLRKHADDLNLPQLDLTSDAAAESSDAKLIWLPMLGDDFKWGAFHSCEAFILPSHQENFGIAVAEALSCGRPVLISNKVNIWREISDDGAGLVEPDTEAGVSELLSRWAQLDSSARATMSEAATQCFAQRYEITHAAESLASTIADCLNDK